MYDKWALSPLAASRFRMTRGRPSCRGSSMLLMAMYRAAVRALHHRRGDFHKTYEAPALVVDRVERINLQQRVVDRLVGMAVAHQGELHSATSAPMRHVSHHHTPSAISLWSV